MKTKFCNIGFLFAILLGSLFSCSQEDTNPDSRYMDLIKGKLDCMNMPRPEDSFDYPVYPGMEEWASYPTLNLQMAVCQIPSSILDSMSTQAVVQAIWEHPLFTDIAKDEGNYKSGFENIIAKTNAYKELLMREDGARCLLERYRKVKFVSGQELLPKALEILLSQEVLYQLSYPERIDLMRSILKEKDRTEISTLFLTGQIMYGVYFLPLIEDLKSDEILSAFLETSASGQIGGRQLDIINTNAELFCTYQNDNFEDMIKDRLDCMNMSRPKGSFNYYVYPGMKEWSVFTATWQMVSTSQVPEPLLKGMSTQAVIQAIWEYPFFIEIGFQFDHYVVSFRNIIEPLNAYKELLLRKDAAYCLLERYRLVHSIAAEIWHPKALEILFSQEAFLSQLDYKEKKEAVRLAFEKDQIRQDNPAHANSLTREISWFLIGRVMRNAEYAPFMKEMEANEALRVFLDTSFLDRRVSVYEQSRVLLRKIIDYGEQFIKE